jgi:hypothetical protein
MSYEEEDTCYMRGGRKRKGVERQSEDSCHMRRRIHVI